MVVLEWSSILLWCITAAVLVPLYTHANGKRPLIAGNLVVLGLVGVAIALDLLDEGLPTVDRILLRIAITVAIVVPALVLLWRKPHVHTQQEDEGVAHRAYELYRALYPYAQMRPWEELSEEMQASLVGAIILVRRVLEEESDRH